MTVGTLADGDGSLLQELSTTPEIATFSLHVTKRAPWRVMDLAVRLGENRPNLIIANLFHAYISSRILGKLLKRISVVSVFHSSGQGRWRSLLDRLTMQLSDCFVAVSNDSAQFAREELRVPEKKLRFIPNGVDVEWLRSPQAPREETRKQLGLAERDFVIGCVARFHPVKDHETLLRAFEKLRRSKEGKHARLLLVGKGEDGLKVRALAEQLRLLEHVVFTGFRRDLPEIYSAMDAFCLTSRHEGMPTAVLEAMAATRPVVATEVPGTSDVLHHGQNALLAPAGDATAIALALSRIINDPELASRLTRQASADVSERYGIKACAAAYCTLIRELL